MNEMERYRARLANVPHFTVWRRNDGWVNASNRSYPMTERDLNYTGANGNVFSFEVLLVTTDWDEALKLIKKERAK